MSEKQQFLDAWGRECPTTLKLLKAYPAAKADLKPHERCRSAKELAWTFVFEGVGGAQALDGELKFPPKNMPPVPDKWDGVVAECERVPEARRQGAQGKRCRVEQDDQVLHRAEPDGAR